MPSSPTPADTSALNRTPYDGLTPDVVLDALAEVGHFGDGRLIQLNSYENRVFQVFLEDRSVVVAKFYRPGRWSDAQILEEHAFAAELAAQDIPVVAPLALGLSQAAAAPSTTVLGSTLATVHTAGGPYRFSLSPRRSGRPPELEDPAVLAWIGRFIGRMHAVGHQGAFAHRRQLSVSEFGTASRDYLLENQVVSPEWVGPWTQVVDAVLGATQARFDALAQQQGGLNTLRLHGDCHAGNVLWTEAGPHFVDLDDALTGPAVQDLWMLLSGEKQAAKQQLRALLSGYEQFAEFDDRELALIEPLRSLRIIHYSAWLARRWTDPAFPSAFPWFGTSAYWSEQITQLQDQLDAMQAG